ncbi:type IV pilus twitching motility protein PilT [Thermoanaerobacterium sp. RBIITD]|uniref:type IV pilus twitching motility protein PilT n=1 Tax=Thermoanaerobacterium sp. RBIITD TaxID=1550240 RepID=UPI000BB8A467|nr:type IV pilus twitching motility protein PilT [Thermoanaerobacterium sp. RBIITD]SNX55339.1 twitching motility protein PilT [Thermoanaerobacterium sp. RBIITD]
MKANDLLKLVVEKGASDLHITVGIPPVLRINGYLEKLDLPPLTPQDTEDMTRDLLKSDELNKLDETGDIDLSYSVKGLGRFRINAYKQRGTYSLAIRSVSLRIPTLEELGLPSVTRELALKTRGLILVTGPTGSGKSTTLASMIDLINNERNCHILTLEDPIEYLHKHKRSIVNQREIGHDSISYANALRAAMREDPDVILVGEMRDLETIQIAITAAETGHLVLSTLHTIGAAKTIDRIIDVFPPHQQQQIKVQLSNVLEGIISQQLLPKIDNSGRVVAVEVMIATPAIRNLIREGKSFQIQSMIQTGNKFGMITMDMSISQLLKRNLISMDDALTYCVDRENFSRMI